MSRILGIDLGERRIGLAVAEADGWGVRPLSTLGRSATLEEDAVRLAQVVREQQIGELVVGLPLEASGQEGAMSRAARTWAQEIGARLGLPVALRDERLSSHLAEQALGPMKRGSAGGPPGRTRRNEYRARVDREAAAIILRDELDARAAGSAPTPENERP